MIIIDTSCLNCKHLNADLYTCKAFPEGIINTIVTGELFHFEPIEGDNGIQFEPIEVEKPNV